MPDFTPLELVAAAFATWRITALLVFDNGPFGIFLRLRERLGIVHDDNGDPSSWPDGGLGRLFTCVWCLSFWTALAVCGILWVQPYVVMFLALWGAVSFMEALRPRP